MTTQKYVRIGTVGIDLIHDAQSKVDMMARKPAQIELFGVNPKLFSKGSRLKTFFVHGTTCSACGLEASYYAVERPAHESVDFPYHLNLWGLDEDGNEVLFTHDHTLARSAGGKDNVSNTTTMCSPCNFAKSLYEKRRG